MRFSPAKISSLTLALLFLPALSMAYVSYQTNSGNNWIILVVGLGFGIFLFFKGFSKLQAERLMKDIPLSTIRAMAQGLVEINGETVELNLLQTPMTNKSCVYYECRVEQLVSSGKSSHWETIQKESSSFKPFSIRDETATTMVYPDGAVILIPNEFQQQTGTFQRATPELEQYLQSRNIREKSFIFEKTLRFTERCIFPGERLFVMGTCKDNTQAPLDTPAAEGTPKDAPGEESMRVCVGNSESGKAPFYISHKSQKELETEFSWEAFGGIFGGIALIGVCLYFLLALAGLL